jgi:hypothetical protein
MGGSYPWRRSRAHSDISVATASRGRTKTADFSREATRSGPCCLPPRRKTGRQAASVAAILGHGSSMSLTDTLKDVLRRRARRRRGRRYYRLGQGMSSYYRGTGKAMSVPDRFYRRALRNLDGPPSMAKATEVSPRSPLVRAVASRLADQGIGAAMWRHRGAILGGLTAIGFSLLILVGVSPTIRRGLSPQDLAAGKLWTASSAWADFPQAGAMSDPARPEGLFHTVEQASPSVTVDLGAAVIIAKVQIDNRADCCFDRTLPLALELSIDGATWARVGYRRAQFRSWTATFPPTSARFVRARIDRVSILHLRRIRVYP